MHVRPRCCTTAPALTGHGAAPPTGAPAQIRRMHPQAAIVQLVWPQEALLAGLLEPQQSVPYQKYMAAGFQRLQALGAQGVHLLQLSGTEVKRERWDW